MDYRILIASTVGELEGVVSGFLQTGWVVSGGLVVVGSKLCQPVIKPPRPRSDRLPIVKPRVWEGDTIKRLDCECCDTGMRSHGLAHDHQCENYHPSQER
jgi:hypothetical protein